MAGFSVCVSELPGKLVIGPHLQMLLLTDVWSLACSNSNLDASGQRTDLATMLETLSFPNRSEALELGAAVDIVDKGFGAVALGSLGIGMPSQPPAGSL